MTQQLTVHTALAEDLNMIPSTHVQKLMTASNSSSKESDILFWPPEVPILSCTSPYRHTDTAKDF